MKFIFFLMALPLLNNKCDKKNAIPACVKSRIEELKKEPRQNPAAEVNEYTFNGKRVFLFNSPCCDQFNYLYDTDCDTICAPSGGYTGKGDQKCLDFTETATHVKLVWKDER
ncbi:MAG: hypothetical protein EOO01_16435 [Chitinophagaceae bacterium]|nr:MAG: hypothetical protein EOO01_16435 [Chitinophagaceae bacterium]